MATRRQIHSTGLIGLLLLGAAGCAGGSPTVSSEQAADSITNNQEAGVDEGGIVKAWGDHLIVLRRGRLFTVDLSAGGMQPTCAVDAYAPDGRPADWYDELLVDERTVVVVGYSYDVEATELGLFSLDAQGCPRHEATYYLQSNDYYSSRNYASRLVDGRLVMYMPHWLGDYEVDDGEIEPDNDLPRLGHPSGLSLFERLEWDEIVDPAALELPEQRPEWPTLHTVITCELRAGFTCSGRGIVGDWGRTFYVSRDAVFVWVSQTYHELGLSTVYRLPLDGGPSGAVRAWGAPVDQFSFQQDDDGYLNVVVRAETGGDWMWGPEISAGAVALARIPLDAFTSPATVLADNAYVPLPGEAESYGFRNRFVGDHLLYGVGDPYGYYGWNGQDASESQLVVHRVGSGDKTRALQLMHRVERIEALGEHAIVIGPGPAGLYFTSIALGPEPRVAGVHFEPSAGQGEQRSHGFFYRQDEPGHGILGLPLQRGSTYYGYLTDASVSVLYLAVDQLAFQSLGTLDARGDSLDDACVASCVDWYGNSRPIFYRGRVFALMGYELVEGRVADERIGEVGRVHLLADQPRSALVGWLGH